MESLIITPKGAMLEYENAKLEIRRLEALCKKLQPEILPLVPEDKNIVTEKGYFYIQKRPTWKYTSEVITLEAQVEKMKDDQKANGDATAEYKNTLYFKEGAPKEVQAE